MARSIQVIFILSVFITLFSVSFAVAEHDSDYTRSYEYHSPGGECYTQCDSLGYTGAFDAECRDNCAVRLAALVDPHEGEVITEPVVKEPEVEEEVMEEKVTPTVEDGAIEEEAIEDKKETPCKSTSKNLKSCSFEGYAPFIADKNANAILKDGVLTITVPSGGEATLTYNDGSKVIIEKGAVYVPTRLDRKIGFFERMKNLWNRLFGKSTTRVVANIAVRG